TILGPALGGVRMWKYESEEEALFDVLRLSKAMTYKAAVAGLNLGGGKAVIIGDPRTQRNEALFRAFGRFVQSLGGRYITAEDVGTDEKVMEWIYSETKFVTGIPESLGGSGNPAPVTAYGVYVGIKACVKEVYGNESLEGKKIAIQGVGQVGRFLCQHLVKDGAKLYITDIVPEKVKLCLSECKAEYVEPDKIYDVDADIFAPCALGGIINDETIPRFKFKIIAGGANNQLLDEDKHDKMLMEHGILYAPDYVINAGGLINVGREVEGYSKEHAMKKAEGIYDTLMRVFEISKKEKIPTHVASARIAEERIMNAFKIRKISLDLTKASLERRYHSS
ncbi:leucine dehydrogenase, partial [Candidatus Kryptonium thompsonii]